MPDERSQLIEQYLDGSLTGDRRAAFEARMKSDVVLAREVQRQQEIDDSIRRQMPMPTGELLQSILAQVSRAEGNDSATAPTNDSATVGRIESAAARSRPNRWLAAAAIIAVALGGIWAAWQWKSGAFSGSGVSPMLLDPVAYYQRKTESGFQPIWVCDTDHEFAKFFVDRFGQPVLLKPMPPGVSCAGIDYTTVLSGDTASLLINDGTDQIVVLLDRLENDRPLMPAKKSGLNSFRREVGNYVAWEITPMGSPRILDLLYIPDRVPDMPPGADSDSEPDSESPSSNP